AVASGVLVKASFDGGVRTAVLGLALHFAIAYGWATVFYLAARRQPGLLDWPAGTGLVYGAFVFAFMNLVVLPLSNTPRRTAFSLVVLGTGLMVHMVGVGLPIVL